MIHEVDEALRALIRRDALGGTDIEVAFDAPTKDWSSRRNAPTIDLYLYDIREDLRRREVGRVDARNEEGQVTARLVPPRWFKLSYLLTAWTQRSEDEHRLLAACLGCFLRNDRVPADVLVGSLADLRLPLPYTIALPPPEDRALSDVWSALGGELKPSLDLVVIAPFDLSRELEAGPPVREEPRVDLGIGTAWETFGGANGVGTEAPGASGESEPDEPTARPGRAGRGRRASRGGAAAEGAPPRGADGDESSATARGRSAGEPHSGGGSEDEAADAEGPGLDDGQHSAGAPVSPRWRTGGARDQWRGGTAERPGRMFRLGERPRPEPPT